MKRSEKDCDYALCSLILLSSLVDTQKSHFLSPAQQNIPPDHSSRSRWVILLSTSSLELTRATNLHQLVSGPGLQRPYWHCSSPTWHYRDISTSASPAPSLSSTIFRPVHRRMCDTSSATGASSPTGVPFVLRHIQRRWTIRDRGTDQKRRSADHVMQASRPR